VPGAPHLSVVVLCYRAEAELARVVGPLHDELEAEDVASELILVSNYWRGSSDTTPEHAAAFAREHPRVTVVSRPKAGGMGWDLRSGLDVAGGSYLVYLDGDGQVATHDALRVYRRLRETGADVVKGRREVREDGSVRTAERLDPRGVRAARRSNRRLVHRRGDRAEGTGGGVGYRGGAGALQPAEDERLACRARHGLGVPRQHGALAARPPPCANRRRPKSAPQSNRARPPLGAR
jgi:glycosyltransferase involved in cell wall biosynthesis